MCALPLGYLTFPFPTFVIAVIFCVARVVYQFGITKGFGWHYLGFWPFQLCHFTLMGLLWLAFMHKKSTNNDMDMDM